MSTEGNSAPSDNSAAMETDSRMPPESKGDDSSHTDQDETVSCTSSLEEEEEKPHWDVGAGDVAIYNDIPSDRNIVRFLQRAKIEVTKILMNVLLRRKTIKYNIVLQVRFSNNYSLPPTPFKSDYITLENAAAIDDTYDVLADLIVLKTEKFHFVYQILRLEINIKKLRPRCGAYIELPAKMPSLKSIINFRNHDNYCFKYAILIAVKYLLKYPGPMSMDMIDISSDKLSFAGMDFDFSGLTFPVEVRDVRLFEKNNPTMSVNVFGLEKKKSQYTLVGPLYRTRREQKTHINLLFLENPQRNLTHYAYITKLARLLSSPSKKKNLAYYCNTCLNQFIQLKAFQEHKTDKRACVELRTLS